jgi:hypothetical protein
LRPAVEIANAIRLQPLTVLDERSPQHPHTASTLPKSYLESDVNTAMERMMNYEEIKPVIEL